MKAIGVLLILLGALFVAVAGMNASEAPNVSYLAGTFLPGLVFLIFGLKLAQTKKQMPRVRAIDDDTEAAAVNSDANEHPGEAVHSRADAFKSNANLSIGFGVLLMFLGSGIVQGGEGWHLAGLLISLVGLALEIWGCVNYMRWKGHSGWFGLFGYLLLLGLLILVCFPNRRKRLLQNHGSEQIGEIEEISKADRRPGYRFLLTLVPVGVFGVAGSSLMFFAGSSIDAAEWREVARPDIGFQALMPGTPRIVQDIQKAPAGNVELHKFMVTPKNKSELFMIISVRFPEDVGRELGGQEKLLELGKKDLLAASKGDLKSERKIMLNNRPGLELEVLPPKGAIIKAQIFATNNQIYQVWAHVPKIRLASEDVQKFFDSFKLSAEAVALPVRGK